MNNAFSFIGYHCKIFLRGFAKVVYGTAVAGLVAMAVYGFCAVPSEDGYIAVCDFIGSAVTMAMAITCMYAFGGRKKKSGRYVSHG